MHSLHLFIDISDRNSNTIITITSTHNININQSNYIDINTTFINVYSHSSLNFQRLRTSVRTKRWTSERFQPTIKQIPPLSLSRVVFFSKTREKGRTKERRVARGVEEGLQTGLERQWNNVTWVRRIGVKWEIRVTRCHVAVHHAVRRGLPHFGRGRAIQETRRKNATCRLYRIGRGEVLKIMQYE